MARITTTPKRVWIRLNLFLDRPDYNPLGDRPRLSVINLDSLIVVCPVFSYFPPTVVTGRFELIASMALLMV
jgi:hypothetical protein